MIEYCRNIMCTNHASSPQRCLTVMNRGFAFGLVNHYMCHFGLKDPKVLPQLACDA